MNLVLCSGWLPTTVGSSKSRAPCWVFPMELLCVCMCVVTAISSQQVTGSVFGWLPSSEADLEKSLVQVVALGSDHWTYQLESGGGRWGKELCRGRYWAGHYCGQLGSALQGSSGGWQNVTQSSPTDWKEAGLFIYQFLIYFGWGPLWGGVDTLWHFWPTLAWVECTLTTKKETSGRESHVFLVRGLQCIEMRAKVLWVECHQSLGSWKVSAGWTGLRKPCIKLSGFHRGSSLGSFHWVPASPPWDTIANWKSSGDGHSQEPSPASGYQHHHPLELIQVDFSQFCTP